MEKRHWEDVWDKVKILSISEPVDRQPINREILKVLDNVFPPRENLSAMEIGGAPGQFLACLLKYRAYEAYAIDFTKSVVEK